MALRWLEAFQGSRNATIFSRLYTSVSGTLGSNFVDEFGRSQFGSATLTATTPALVGSVQNTWIIGFGFQVSSGSLADAPSAFPFISLRDSVGEQLRCEIVADNASPAKPGGFYYKIRVMRGATELARTVQRFDGNISAEHRTYFDFRAVVRTSTNGSFTLQYRTFKGASATATWSAANTGINTANQGTDGSDRSQISWNTGTGAAQVSFSDIYLCDNTGAKNNAELGPLYSEGLKPAGNGSTLQWTLAGTAVSIEDALNEAVATQNTTEDDRRITSDTVGDISLATMTDLSALVRAASTFIGMQVDLYGKMETVGSRDVQFFYRKTTGSPAQTGGGILDLDSTTIVGEADVQENDPNTGTNWVLADINGIQLGVELDA